MSNKQFGPSRGAASVTNRLAAVRYGESADAGPAEPAPVVETPAAAPAKPKMVTRSWYLPAETADRLTRAADQLWRELPGTSKHEVLAALLEAGLARTDDVRAQLSQTEQTSQS